MKKVIGLFLLAGMLGASLFTTKVMADPSDDVIAAANSTPITIIWSSRKGYQYYNSR